MATEIWREFDPNLPIPIGLKNAREKGAVSGPGDPNADINIQYDTLDDDDSELDEDYVEDELGVPGVFTIVSQTVRTAPDGTQVIDVVVDVEDIDGAESYELRVTK
jgi:hypothetical protein